MKDRSNFDVTTTTTVIRDVICSYLFLCVLICSLLLYVFFVSCDVSVLGLMDVMQTY